MTGAVLLNRLIANGDIERVRVNRYELKDTSYIRQLGYRVGGIYTRTQIDEMFFIEVFTGDYSLRRIGLSSYQVHSGTAAQVNPIQRPLRTISREGYHANGSGTSRNGCFDALCRIARDADGVRRSFGLEWEIRALTPRQEDKLANLLDTLPAHYTERDGSLASTGVEIVFLPLGEADIIGVWNTLQAFCRDNSIDMDGTGAHLTYGVSNSTVERDDLQIRINRIALAVKSASTQAQIKNVFGRDFTYYASLPNSTTVQSHTNAWSASRGNSAYELRLCHWQGKIEKITEFMKATEFVFTRTFTAQDFVNIFRIMGSNCAGC